MKNREEDLALTFLRNNYGKNVFPVPEHKDPPDIIVNSTIGVEVRRLNENYCNEDHSEGLEQISIPLLDVFRQVLRSFDSVNIGKSYWVGIDYQRPLLFSVTKTKENIRRELEQFIYLQDVRFPYTLQVSDEIELIVIEATPERGVLFSYAGSLDHDSGGIELRPYTDNIRLCIREKSQKIINKLDAFSQWWLILVDRIYWPLNPIEISQIHNDIDNTGLFDMVVIINTMGQEILTINWKNNKVAERIFGDSSNKSLHG